MQFVICTHNPLVAERYDGIHEVVFIDGSYGDVLKYTRDRVHEGYELLTHPLSGSVKPGETPYKSVMISKKRGRMMGECVIIIEDAILALSKFRDRTGSLSEKVLSDFRMVDFTLIDSAIPSTAAR